MKFKVTKRSYVKSIIDIERNSLNKNLRPACHYSESYQDQYLTEVRWPVFSAAE